MSQRRGASDRLLAAIPLLTLYFGLAALYAWQASRHPVPTIYSDEIELAWLSRSIAETGEAARRGDPYGLATLVAYFLAPVWWIGSAATGYAAAKLLLVLAMTATVFPAYALARLVVPPWYALAAAGGATIVPALAYSPILVEEPLAYPLATLALWLIARVYVDPTWGRAGLALLACTAAMLTRTQLSILFALFVLGLLWLCWQSERSLRWRATFSGWDWVGLVTLGVGAAVGASALLGHLSKSWRDTTGAYPERILEHAAWASGALAIGIGVLPLLAGVAALARPRGEATDPKTRAFVITSVFALVVFVAYAGIKGAQISITFSTLVVERNLIYLCPILFAATALAFVAWGRARLGDRGRDGVHRVRRQGGAAAARQLPVLRGARALAAGVLEPRVGLARGTDREHACSPRASSPSGSSSRSGISVVARTSSPRSRRLRRSPSSRGRSRPRCTQPRESAASHGRSPTTCRRRTTGSTARPAGARSSSSASR